MLFTSTISIIIQSYLIHFKIISLSDYTNYAQTNVFKVLFLLTEYFLFKANKKQHLRSECYITATQIYVLIQTYVLNKK